MLGLSKHRPFRQNDGLPVLLHNSFFAVDDVETLRRLSHTLSVEVIDFTSYSFHLTSHIDRSGFAVKRDEAGFRDIIHVGSMGSYGGVWSSGLVEAQAMLAVRQHKDTTLVNHSLLVDTNQNILDGAEFTALHEGNLGRYFP